MTANTLENATDFYDLQAAKRELAMQMQAALLMARIRIMSQEIFPAHHVLAEYLQEAA